MKKYLLSFSLLFSLFANAQIQTWQDVGSGLNSSSHGMCIWNNMLIDGGSFNSPCARVAGWDGTTWNCFGAGVGIVARECIAWNGNLVVVGDFWNVNQPCTNCNGIAMWDGTQWTALGTGFNNDVLCLTIWNGQLVAGGDFTMADGNPCDRVAVWNGTNWYSLGGFTTTFSNDVRTMTSYNGELWVGGDFANAGGCTACDGVVKWNGTAWVGGNSGVDIVGGVDSTVRVLYVDPNTNLLYLGGHFTELNSDPNCSRVAVYNGTAWSPMGQGVNDYVRGIHNYNGNIIVGGNFSSAGATPASKIAKWNPNTSTWSAMGLGMNDYVKAIDVYNGELYAGGPFTTADGLPRSCVAKWYEVPAVPPTADFTMSTANICLNQCINVTDISLDNPTTWSWTFTGGSPSSSASQTPPSICYNTAGTYNVTLQACNINGCDTYTQSVVVSSFSAPVVTLAASPSSTICAGNSTTLTASGASTYSWSPATGLSATTGATVTANPTVTTTYSITGTSGFCSSTNTITVTVNPSPTVTVTPTSVTVCPGSPVVLNANGASSYSWLPTTALSATTGPTVTASPNSTITYTVTGTASGCSATATSTINIDVPMNLPLVEGFESLPFLPANWSMIDAGSDGNIWQRNTSVGGFGTSTNCSWFPNNSINAPGTRDEMRTMKLNFASLSSAQMTFDVAYCKRTSPTGSDTLSVLVSTDCGATWTQLFLKGGSTLATAPNQNSTFTPTAAQWRTESINIAAYLGQPNVMFSFRNHNWNGNNLYVDNINITGVYSLPPTAAFQMSSSTICSGSCATMTDNSTGSPTTWNWNFPSGTPANSTLQNPGSVCWSTSGTYAVRLISCNANGCDTIIQNIVVVAPIVATSSTSGITCFGGNDGTATVVATGGSGTYSYLWSPSGGTGATASGLSVGTYSCAISDGIGCSTTITVSVTEPTLISATSVNSQVSCFGGADGSIDLTATGGVGGYTYNWDSGTYLTEDITGLSAAIYSVVITDANGCTGNQVVTITEPPVLSSVLASSTNPTACSAADGSIDISVTGGTPGYSFLWNNNATTEDLSGVLSGGYFCTVTDNNGCTSTVSATLNDPNAPTVTLALTNNIICQSTTAPFVLTGESPAGGTFSGPGVIGNMFDPMQAGIGQNVISYSYTDINGCIGTAVDSILVDVCTGISISTGDENGFTIYPNPSGGEFSIMTNLPGQSQVIIYDMLGKSVYSGILEQGKTKLHILNTPGIYSVTITNNNGKSSTKRFVVLQ